MKSVSAIDRNDLLDQVSEKKFDWPTAYATGYNDAIRMAREKIYAAPEIDAAPAVHGHWIHCKGKSNLWHCSECGREILYNPKRRTYNIVKMPVFKKNKFCRSCGAKMDGKGETDE